MLQVNSELSIPLTEFEMQFSRSPGPGGQNVNKVNSKVQLRWDVTNSPSLPDAIKERFLLQQKRRISKDGKLLLSSSRFRDQPRNVEDVLEKLRELILDVAKPPKLRKKKKVSKAAKRRRLTDKRLQADKKRSRRSTNFD
ncbi:MAG TPA: alternative ribosome rescue aminoacyl-tRNA hydrolase ArfB [Pirellulaceae bacterium]|nr:alternative ribosome rescue aminoacyl-tRNA hydrolase ArfB [Pirellulaceae bacterium]HMO91781.1 alternative ribosome rescue aminoacyl-tRNA hydrolase ArfB [Pirellulaceae bacterium]HMP69580.1 alternative ribosome rescue aminoacyl-tRNA hydrolase ArfB [Pirellulaceae bacterium]